MMKFLAIATAVIMFIGYGFGKTYTTNKYSEERYISEEYRQETEFNSRTNNWN